MSGDRDELRLDLHIVQEGAAPSSQEEQPSLDSIIGRLRYGGERMDLLEERLRRIEESAAATQASMRHNTEMTRDVHELLVAIRSGLETLAKIGRALAALGRWLHRFFKWALPIAAGVAFIWHQFHNVGVTPPPPTPPTEFPPGIDR